MNSKGIKALAVITCLLMGSGWVAVDGANLTGIRTTNEVNRMRLVMDVDGAPKSVKATYDKGKEILSVQLGGTANQMKQGIDYSKGGRGLLKGVEISEKGNQLTVSLAVNEDIKHNTFQLTNPNRIVVDLFTEYTQKINKELKGGVEFLKWDSTTEAGPIRAYVLKVPKKEGVRVGLVPEGKPVSEVQGAVTAAIGLREAGSFNSPKVLPEGQVITHDGQLHATAALRYTKGNGYTMKFNRPSLAFQSGSLRYPIQGVNKDRGENALMLYTSAYGASTRTNVYGQEVVIAGGKVVKMNGYDTPLKGDQFILSGHGVVGSQLKKLKVGDPAKVLATKHIATVKLADAVEYIGGIPVLENGFVVAPKDGSRRGRTFLGVTGEGNFMAMAVGHGNSSSVGVTSLEGANLLKSLGARQGLELMGQGSVDMWVGGKLEKVSSGSTKLYSDILVFM